MSELLALFADNLLPILLAASLGFLIQKFLGINPRPLSQVTFYIFSPALVFDLLVSTDIQGEDILRLMAFAVATISIVAAASWAAARGFRLEPKLAAAFMLSATFMNAGNYGLSVNSFAFGDVGLAWASLFFVSSAMMTNSAGVYIAAAGRASPIKALQGLLKVPAMYAIPLALLVRTQGLTLPLAIWRPIELLGSAAVPCMLLILGMQISLAGFPAQKGLLAVCVAFRLILSPMVAWLMSSIFGIEGAGFRAGILEAAMPTAVLSSIIAIEFDVEPGFVTGAILATTLFSPLTVIPLIALLGG